MANEKRLIDAVELADHVFTITMYVTGMRNGKTILKECLEKYRNEVLRAICKAPTVDAVEVVHGRWIHDQVEGCNPIVDSLPIWVDVMQCSVCKEYIEGSHGSNYCPNCGAKMDGERRTNETD